jgi:trehalose-6-phosphate synthase
MVNPYDTQAMAEALERALVMPEAEQKERMRLMRDLLRVRNVYRWAGQMLLDAARLRSQQRIVAEGLAEVELGLAPRLTQNGGRLLASKI